MATIATPAWTSVVPGTSRGTRNAATFALQMAMDTQRQLEMAGRIRECRGPRPQPVIADEVGVRLRTYQHWEEGHGISWPNLQKLAEFFAVSENWLLYGADEAQGPVSQLDRIEKKIDELLALGLERELEDAAQAAPRGDGSAAKTAGSRRRA